MVNFDSFWQFFGPRFPFNRSSEPEDTAANKFYSEMFGDNELNNEIHQLDELINMFIQESFSQMPNFHDFFHGSLPNNNGTFSGSLRDQMLKPDQRNIFGNGSWEPENSRKTDVDLDEAVKKNGSIDVLLPKIQDNGMHYSTRSSMNYYYNSNGAVETTSTLKDREGCHRQLVTREFNGKKYILEKRQCPGVPEETTETLVNLTREELPEFLSRWKFSNSGNKD